jgi:hypothetical protein
LFVCFLFFLKNSSLDHHLPCEWRNIPTSIRWTHTIITMLGSYQHVLITLPWDSTSSQVLLPKVFPIAPQFYPIWFAQSDNQWFFALLMFPIWVSIVCHYLCPFYIKFNLN